MADSVHKQSLQFPELLVSFVLLKETKSIFKKEGDELVNTADPKESIGVWQSVTLLKLKL